nr:MAG TPA: hypothetical protein [Caudoviricetes sp.]
MKKRINLWYLTLKKRTLRSCLNSNMSILIK